jgi:succinate dehydrogenase / fumarate reductase, flavoprotein subunit
MWEYCGMARTANGLKKAIKEIQALRVEFNNDIYVSGTNEEFNPELEKALRVADFIDLGELMCMDALNRNESCGGHFRVEYQDESGEAKRDDDNYMYVAAWQSKGAVKNSELHKEDLVYENIKLVTRSYK